MKTLSFINVIYIHIQIIIDMIVLIFKNKFDLNKASEELDDMLIRERRKQWDLNRKQQDEDDKFEKELYKRLNHLNEELDERLKKIEIKSEESEKNIREPKSIN